MKTLIIENKPDTKHNHSNDYKDKDKLSHYAKKKEILESAVTGKPIVALCGKRWIPNRDPEKFKICSICKKIYENI